MTPPAKPVAPPAPPAPPAPVRQSHAQRSARTRQQVLDAAATLVRTGGMQAASMFEVAKAAGVTPGALQHHFGSKAELMMQVLQHQIEGNGGAHQPGSADVDAPDATPLAWPAASLPLKRRAEAWVQTLWESLYETPRFLTAWGIYFGSCSDPALRQRVVGLRKGVTAKLSRRFADTFPELAGQRGTPAFLALVLASLRGLAVLRLFDPSPTGSQAARRELARLIAQRCAEATANTASPRTDAARPPAEQRAQQRAQQPNPPRRPRP